MRVPIYTVAIPLLAAMAFAQDTPPTQPKQPTDPAAAEKTAKDTKADKTDKTDKQASSDRLPETKTQTYSGTLMDASCAGSGTTPASPAASADRSAPAPADNQSCAVSANTTQFALKLQDGKTVKFDDVGNLRAQESFKVHKKWSDIAASSKPLRVKASGVLDGDKLTVLSVN